MSSFQILVLAVLATPLLTGLCVGLPTRLGADVTERFVRVLLSVALSAVWLGSVAVAYLFWRGHGAAIEVPAGELFRLGDYAFGVSFLVDGASAPMMLLTTTLAGIVGRFSFRYMHREPGFVRFFVLLCFFETGMLIVSLSGGLDILVMGWELVGISSALLVAFFTNRTEPRDSALIVFVTYRLCDVGLLVAGVLLHHHAHSAQFSRAFGAIQWPLATAHLPAGGAALIAVALTVAAVGKSAQLPTSAWLPRAMEGPTPSTAIFYGALSVHAGAFLLLRAQPVLEEVPVVRGVIVAIGLLTAAHATLVGRAQADVKTSLAYASMTQVGIIFAEIGLGFYRVALLHIVGHAAVRAWQLLRAPSFLHESHVVRDALEGDEWIRGRHAELVLPERARRWLFRLAIERFHLETLFERFLTGPTVRLAGALDAMERRLARTFAGPPAQPDRGEPLPTEIHEPAPESAPEQP